MRAFISVNLSPIVVEAVAALQERLRPRLNGYRWTRAANCHLTLKFLGDIQPETVPLIDQSLIPIAQRAAPFTIQLAGLGCFPPKSSPSILWVGVTQGAEVLKTLEIDIRGALQTAGIDFDRKPFSPHLTIARAIRGRETAKRPSPDEQHLRVAELRVESFHLMQSDLHSRGAVYTVVSRYELGQNKRDRLEEESSE